MALARKCVLFRDGDSRRNDLSGYVDLGGLFSEGRRRTRPSSGDGKIAMHRFVLIELMLGHVPNREENLTCLELLPTAKVANEDEIRRMITRFFDAALDSWMPTLLRPRSLLRRHFYGRMISGCGEWRRSLGWVRNWLNTIILDVRKRQTDWRLDRPHLRGPWLR